MNYSEGLPLRSFSEGALTKLQTMSWPGNIRQLRNAVEQILILGPNNGEIDSSELPESKQPDKNNTGNSVFQGRFYKFIIKRCKRSFEREYLMAQINRFGGNISKTAIFVGMERSALHRKMKTLSIVSENKISKKSNFLFRRII